MLGVYLRGWAIISPINFSTVSISILISAAEKFGRLQSDNGRGVRDTPQEKLHKKVAAWTYAGARCAWRTETGTCRGKRLSRSRVLRYWMGTLRMRKVALASHCTALQTLPDLLKSQWRTRHAAAWQCYWDKTGVLICLVRLAGIEPTTLGFGGQYSIH
jgi:hypothetical protein